MDYSGYSLFSMHSQFCYCSRFVKANRLYRNWWIFERCNCNAYFRLRILAVMRYQGTSWKYKGGWLAILFWSDPIFIARLSVKVGLARKQITCCSRIDCIRLCVFEYWHDCVSNTFEWIWYETVVNNFSVLYNIWWSEENNGNI